MFYEGARRLLSAGVNIVPCHRTADEKVALEGYPRLVAKYLNEGKYKSEDGRGDHRDIRVRMISGFQDGRIRNRYSFDVCFESDVLAKRIVADESGDQLDAVLCAIQAGWASQQKDFSVPENCQSDEGWIIDPETIASSLTPD